MTYKDLRQGRALADSREGGKSLRGMPYKKGFR